MCVYINMCVSVSSVHSQTNFWWFALEPIVCYELQKLFRAILQMNAVSLSCVLTPGYI
jgi:hypothetical protein